METSEPKDEFEQRYGVNGLRFPIHFDTFVDYLSEKIRNNGCLLCNANDFEILSSEETKLIRQFSKSTNDGGFVPVAAYSCRNCSYVYEMAWNTVARWLARDEIK